MSGFPHMTFFVCFFTSYRWTFLVEAEAYTRENNVDVMPFAFAQHRILCFIASINVYSSVKINVRTEITGVRSPYFVTLVASTTHIY